MTEAPLDQAEAAMTPAAMAVRVLNDARRAYGDLADRTELERYAEQAVADLWRDSIKVTTFVPVLALRQIRDMLDRRQEDRPLAE